MSGRGAASGAARGAAEAGRSPWARRMVLAGWAAKGVVYLALAYIVLQMAWGTTSQDASASGAIRLIAQSAPGTVAIIVLGAGLLFHAIGRILEATVLATPAIETKDKAEAVVLAVLYGALAITAFTVAGLSGGSGGGSGGSSQQQGSALLLGLPGGRWIVGILGVAAIAYGLYTIYKGVKKKFLPTLRTAEMSATARTWVRRIGVLAFVTKGAIIALLGYFFLQSALTYDPGQARGLDSALSEVAAATWGTALLTAVALGLLCYGAFCEVEARYRRVGSSVSGTA